MTKTVTKDFYSLLGVNRNAGKDELKRAYRKKAIESHPDRHKGDKKAEERFKDINEAYSILSDESKRKIYDQYGYEGIQRGMGAGGNRSGSSPFGDMGGFSSFSDMFEEAFRSDNVFESFFNGKTSQGGQTRSNKGEDLQYEIEISLQEAFAGTDYNFNANKRVSCSACRGSGAAKGSSNSRCTDCGGHGQVRQNKGIFSISTTCPTCRGSGEIIENPCQKCGGGGILQTREKNQVKVPPGIGDGQSIRMSGKGHAGKRGGSAGDLYLHIRVHEDPLFTRDNDNLYCDAHITITQAILGATLLLKNINDENIKVSILPGTQAESMLRLKGKGMPKLQRRGERGDLILRVHITIPKNLDKKNIALYQEISKLQDDDKQEIALTPRNREKKSFWDRFTG